MKPLLIMLLVLLPLLNGYASQDSSGTQAANSDSTRGQQADSVNYDNLYNLARAQAQSGDYNLAIEMYNRLLARFPGDPDALLGRGRAYAWAREYGSAEEDLKRVVDAYPDYLDALSALGDLYLWSDRPQLAIESYGLWAAKAPGDFAPLLARAKAYMIVRDFASARADALQALNLGADPLAVDQLLVDLARIPSATRWESAFAYEQNSFVQSSWSNWHLSTMTVKRQYESGSILVGVSQAQRGGGQDYAWKVDSYRDLWRKAYGNVQFQVSAQPSVFPDYDAMFELYQGFMGAWEAALSARHMNFSGVSVDMFGMALARYQGEWYLRIKGQRIGKKGETGYTGIVSLRRYMGNVDRFLELYVTKSSTTLLTGNEVGSETRKGWSTTIRMQTFVQPSTGIAVGIVHEENEAFPTHNGVHAMLIYRW